MRSYAIYSNWLELVAGFGYPCEIPDSAFRLVFAGSVLSDESTIQTEGIEPNAALYAEVDPTAQEAAQEAAQALFDQSIKSI